MLAVYTVKVMYVVVSVDERLQSFRKVEKFLSIFRAVCVGCILTMGWRLARIVLAITLLIVITISVLGAIARGFSFLTTSPTAISTAMLSPQFTSSDVMALAKALTNSEDGIDKVRAKLSEVIEKLKKVRDEVVLPSVKEAIDDVVKSLEDIKSLLESVKAVSLASEAEIVIIPEIKIFINETLSIINKTLSRLEELLDEFRDDVEALRGVNTALTKIEAVASVLADEALEEAKVGNLDRAVELAQKALNITSGIIDAYYRKAKVFEAYAKAFRGICEALTGFINVHIEFVKTLHLHGFIGVQIQAPEEEVKEETTIGKEVETVKEVEKGKAIYAKLGEPIRVGDWKITVLDVKEATYVREDNSYYRAKEGYKVIIVTLRIENVGDTVSTLHIVEPVIVSDAGKSYERTLFLTPILFVTKDIKLKAVAVKELGIAPSLAPGTYIEGDILFQIPEDEKPTKLCFKVGVFGEYEIVVELRSP